MTRDEELLAFIEAAKAQGASDEFLVSMLRSQGWSPDIVYAAFAKHYAVLTGREVPVRQGIVEGARDAFLHLLSFGTLASWTIALGSLLFDWINRRFVDPVSVNELWRTYNDPSSLAALMVSFPIYLWVTRFILADQQRYPEKRDSGVRKWLTWLALLIAASIIIGDVIAFLNYFLRGEITVRFVSKVAVVMAIAGGVFSYYMRSMTSAPGERSPVYLTLASIAALAGVVAGFTMLGTPDWQRQLQTDARRITDLQALQRLIYQRGTLPQSLEEIDVRLRDPGNGQPYEYHRINDQRYQLCAVFTAESQQRAEQPNFWYHPAGRHCFELHAQRLP
jgi:hypothetical protein